MKKRIKLYILVILLGVIFICALLFYASPILQSKSHKSNLKGKILIHRGDSYYLMNANGTNIRKIDIIRYPVLSSQAKKIAWIVYKDSDIFNEKKEAILVMDVDGKNNKIFEVNIDSGMLRKIEAGDRPPLLWGVRWSANEEEMTLYYAERFKNNPRSYKIGMNIISGDCRIIKELSYRKDNDYEDYWSADLDSPDGTKACTKGDRSDTGLYLIDKLSGKKYYVIIPFHYSNLSWSPDSNKLVYAEHDLPPKKWTL